MGQRRRRRTGSDEGGRRVNIDRGVSAEWRPIGRKGMSWDMAHARGGRGLVVRWGYLLLVPPVALVVLLREKWRRRTLQ